MRRISILNGVITAVMFFAFRGAAQTNSWTKPTSGFWHEPFWSLGVLPDASQSHIMFTNAGWKALAIDQVTARDYRDSMHIQRLTVASPTNTMNTLLLNYAGFQTPLLVNDSVHLGSNSVLLTLSSVLQVGQNFVVDGTVNHGDGSQVLAGFLQVGDTSPGIYNLSNGLLTAGNIIAGAGTTGSIHQSGGRLSINNRLSLGQGDPMTFAKGDGRFELMAGTVTAPTIQIGEARGRLGPPGADGTFMQTGGSNFAGGLLLGWPESDSTSGDDYTYILNDGLLVTSNTFVYGGNGYFAQAGGLHRVDGPLAVAGFYGRSFTPFTAQYTLSGGVVTARSLNIDFGTMSQSAGTNQISGDLVIGLIEAFSRHAFYNLSGGNLGTSNTFVFDSAKGSFSQSGGIHTVHNLLEIAGPAPQGFGPGYTLSAGELIASNIRVSTNATFSQSGGSASAQQIDIAKGVYSLGGGEVLVGGLYIGNGSTGAVHQTDGTLVATTEMILGLGDARNDLAGIGQFELSGGSLSTPALQLGTPGGIPTSPGGEGFFVQNGGSNFSSGLVVGTWDSLDRNESTYALNSGTLATSNTVVHPDSHFDQSGGLHWVNGPLVVRGNISRLTPRRAAYNLSNGLVRSRSLEVDLARFEQLGGSNEVAGDLRVAEVTYLGENEYILSAGVLTTSNTIVSTSLLGTFIQRGGTHVVAGTLDLPARTASSAPGISRVNYRLEGGHLDVRDIRVGSNSVFVHDSGIISNRGTLTLVGGQWQSATGEHQLGALKLNASSTNSSLVLDDNATTLRFANSAGITWDATATLVINNWRGLTNGNGSHRVIFGTNETGLTSQQLAQIRFHNPMALPAGEYSTTILNTGEIVPLEPTGRGPAITYQQSPAQLRLEWPSGYTLQTATNIVGPFEDVNTNSPYTLDTTADPQRFFRFRR